MRATIQSLIPFISIMQIPSIFSNPFRIACALALCLPAGLCASDAHTRFAPAPVVERLLGWLQPAHNVHGPPRP